MSALLRQDEAIAFLLSLIREGGLADAKEAVATQLREALNAALSIYRQDPDLWQRVWDTADQRAEPSLLALLRIL